MPHLLCIIKELAELEVVINTLKKAVILVLIPSKAKEISVLSPSATNIPPKTAKNVKMGTNLSKENALEKIQNVWSMTNLENA